MYLLVDSHVHLYPCYNFSAVLVAAVRNLKKIATFRGLESGNFLPGMILTETHDCRYFDKLCQGNNIFGDGFLVKNISSSHILLSSISDNQSIALFPGRQIATKEKIEVLALLKDVSISDGFSLLETISLIQSQGAIAALNWGLGKWLGSRGDLIWDLLHNGKLPSVLFADTSMRPRFWDDKLLDCARANRISVLAGSDPFRLSKEEQYIGSYALLSNIHVSSTSLSNDLQTIIQSPNLFEIVGRRCSLPTILRRQTELMLSKRK